MPGNHAGHLCRDSKYLVGSITLLAPAIGGSLAGAFGYNATFIGALAANVLALLWLVFLVQDPRKAQQREVNG